MAEFSKIEWCDSTFNPWRGCTKVSPGCANCYAESQSKRNTKTLGIWGLNGTRVVAAESMWREPLKWDKKAKETGVRHRVFCASMADVFEDWAGPIVDSNGVPVSKIDSRPWTVRVNDDEPKVTMNDVRKRLIELIYRTPNLDWLLLTKRPENICRMLGPDGAGLYAHDRGSVPCPQPNLWLGTSVENQKTADERIPHLLRVPAAVRFLSCEPLLGPVSFRFNHRNGSLDNWLTGEYMKCHQDGSAHCGKRSDKKIDWVIIGGESGPDARPCQVDWTRSLKKQCEDARVACFVKQLGSRPTTTLPVDERWPGGNGLGKLIFIGDGFGNFHVDKLDDKKGGDWDEWPEDLRVREFPTV